MPVASAWHTCDQEAPICLSSGVAVLQMHPSVWQGCKAPWPCSSRRTVGGHRVSSH